jgi:hypothetical protein
MEKRRFEVIKGKKAHEYKLAYRFVEAHATNTRLMGVVGLRIQWETEEGEIFYQFFHLDAEEFGLDDYISILDGSSESIDMTTAKVMGGLGGEMIAISQAAAKYLVKEFAKKNKLFKEELPDPISEYQFILEEEFVFSEEDRKELWDKLCEPVRTPIQLVNYYIMRAAGPDQEAMEYLSCNKDLGFRPVEKPAILLKNVIETIENGDQISYVSESLIDADDSYKMVLTEIQVMETEKGWRVDNVTLQSVMNITGTEAAFSLGKDEFISVYHVKNFREMIRRLDREKPQAMRHGYELGLLYTEFNPDNAHVNQSVYYLNDDVYGVYYITEASQFLVAAYGQQRMGELEKYFEHYVTDGLLEIEERFHLDRSLLYEFVHSDYDNFYDFLEEGQ